MCFSLRLFCDSSASGLWHSHVPLPAVGYALFLPAVGFALVLPAVGLILSFFCVLIPCCWEMLFFTRCGSALLASFLRHHPNCPFYPNCWLQLELCSLHGVTLFAAPPHALPRAARGLVVSSTTHSPPPRAARVEGVFPELVCSGSSLLSKQLQHCLSPRVFTSPDDRP